ncbi:hypothetical protein LOD99_9044 [Oopsacas minuta]|uniref:Uncharacterized protein n=1 Tax=Oopsacas minuta TaxID=111878 RepID=A0AAV7JDT0_9METZ|nr:hypothetical protein LOD99_9044 [Oopsacas minuta]
MESLRRMKDEFESIILTANKFIESQNEKLELLDCDIFLDNSLPLRRYRKKNIMPGDEVPDELPTDALERFNIETFNVIMDTTIQSIERRFRIHEDLYASISYFDPRNFDKIKLQNALPDSALEKVSTLLKQHFPEIKVG